jgi:hypothetical protein
VWGKIKSALNKMKNDKKMKEKLQNTEKVTKKLQQQYKSYANVIKLA